MSDERHERTVELFADQRRTRRPPPVLSEGLVLQWVQAYVNRWYSPEAKVRSTLRRRIDRSCDAHGTPRATAYGWGDDAIGALKRAGVIDDHRWARDKARSLLDRGVGVRSIRQRLRAKQVPAEAVDAALDALSEDLAGDTVDPDWEAAVAYARRRRLGPFRREPDPERYRKDLAAMARAGHSYGVARRVLDAGDSTELD